MRGWGITRERRGLGLVEKDESSTKMNVIGRRLSETFNVIVTDEVVIKKCQGKKQGAHACKS